MAIRSAIGAATSRLVQQLMIESVLLAAAGGFAGLLLSRVLHGLLPSVLPANFPRADGIALGWAVTGFAVAMTAITGVLLGVLPAWQLRLLPGRRADDDSNGAIGGTRARARTVIAAAQVALTCALLVGATLLTRSFMAMVGQDRGYEPAHALSATLMLPDFAFEEGGSRRCTVSWILRGRCWSSDGGAHHRPPLSGSENLTGFTMPSLQQPGTEVHAHACARSSLRHLRGARTASAQGACSRHRTTHPRRRAWSWSTERLREAISRIVRSATTFATSCRATTCRSGSSASSTT